MIRELDKTWKEADLNTFIKECQRICEGNDPMFKALLKLQASQVNAYSALK